MSKLGYISKSYGKQINIAVANTYSYNVLSGSNLPDNALIITSNVNEYGEDTGTYSMVATDYEGTPVRLTYTIQEGNGLYYSDVDDAISMHIDNKTIINTINGLSFDISYVLSDDFVIDGYDIFVNSGNIPTASETNYGIASIDNNTIKSNDGSLYVVTSNLNYSNNVTEQYGVGIGDGKTIFVNNGYIYANIDSFDKATNSTFGLVRGGDNTIDINDGVMKVNTSELKVASISEFGIAKADNKTIIYDGSNSITVNEDNLTLASSSQYGIAKVDSISLDIKTNGAISMKRYDDINEYIQLANTKMEEYESRLKEFNDYLASGNILYKGNTIQQLTVNETSVAELIKPKDDEEASKMPEQTVSVVFDIITTCDFKFNIDFKEGTNVSPAISVKEVNYNDEIIYSRDDALNPNTVYKSTEGKKKKITVKFKCKNYRNSVTKTEYVITGITFTAMDSEDSLKFKTEKYSIIRYNSYYQKLINDKKEEEKKTNTEYFVLNTKEVYWS